MNRGRLASGPQRLGLPARTRRRSVHSKGMLAVLICTVASTLLAATYLLQSSYQADEQVAQSSTSAPRSKSVTQQQGQQISAFDFGERNDGNGDAHADYDEYSSLSSSSTHTQQRQQQLLLLQEHLEHQEQQLLQQEQRLQQQLQLQQQLMNDTSGHPSANPRVPPYFEVLSPWKPRAFIWRGMASREECEHMIAISKDKVKKSTVIDQKTGKSVVDPYRTSSGMFLSKAQDEVVEAIEERMAMFSELPAANGEAMQILKYEPGQKYDPHQDYFDDCSDGSTTSPHHKERQVRYCTEETGGQRVATILLYLTYVTKTKQREHLSPQLLMVLDCP
mmetsp:Transcript_6250/g.23035  ORF Transcript_6250/g.23035 Transcript_6250/m.23035 type:complete len:334 (-) Transcript_6250:322-1323(-)